MSHNGRHTISIRDKVWCCCCYCLRQLTKLLQRQFKMDRALCVNRSFLLSLMPLRSGTWSQWDINRGRQGNLEAFSFSIQGLIPYFIFCIFLLNYLFLSLLFSYFGEVNKHWTQTWKLFTFYLTPKQYCVATVSYLTCRWSATSMNRCMRIIILFCNCRYTIVSTTDN